MLGTVQFVFVHPCIWLLQTRNQNSDFLLLLGVPLKLIDDHFSEQTDLVVDLVKKVLGSLSVSPEEADIVVRKPNLDEVSDELPTPVL